MLVTLGALASGSPVVAFTPVCTFTRYFVTYWLDVTGWPFVDAPYT